MKSTDTIGEALRATQQRLEGDDDPAMAELCGLVNQAAEEHATVAAELDRLRAPLPEVDTESLWTNYRTKRGAVRLGDERPAFFAGVEAGRRTRAPQSAPDASLEALAHARREADSVYNVNKGLGAEVAELRTKNAVLEAHLVAVDASRPGLSEEEARPDDRVSMDSELARAVRDTLGETTHYGVMERIEELLDVEKESASRGDVPAEVRTESSENAVAGWTQDGDDWIRRVGSEEIRVENRGDQFECTWYQGDRESLIIRGDLTAVLMAVDGVMNAGSGLAPPGLPEIQSPITDDAIGEAVAQAKSTRLYEDAAHEVLRRHVSGHYEIRVERAETSVGGES